MPTYTVQQGDCVTNIAQRYGFLWTTVWNHANNAALKQLRKDPNVLFPGDQLFIPDLTVQEFPRPTEQRHKFVKKTDSAKLKIRVLDQDQPRAGVPYTLDIDGALVTGTTDADGYVEQPLPPKAQKGRLIVGAGNTRDTFELKFGNLDPVDKDSGVSGRLINLGYGSNDPKEAIMAFQQKEGLPVTGEADAATQDRLKEKFGQ